MRLVRVLLVLFVSCLVMQVNAQIKNKNTLASFANKLNKNQEVTQILLIGDSHIQADWMTAYLREKFQNDYGNAGRGLIFPYSVANSNGPSDFKTYSNHTWENFRLVYDQDIFSEIGASGFVIGNDKPSLLEFDFKPKDGFNKVIIFHNQVMDGEPFQVLKFNHSLKDYIRKEKKIINSIVEVGQTLPEIASKNYTTTTKLYQLNGAKSYKEGEKYITEKNEIIYDSSFRHHTKTLLDSKYTGNRTIVNFPSESNRFLLNTLSSKGNIFYGFQFRNDSKNGVVFNTVGVNGAMYSDFIKYPLQIKQLMSLQPDIVIIALGTNETLMGVGQVDFKRNATTLINNIRMNNSNLPILLVSPPENAKHPNSVAEVSKWTEEIANTENVAFCNLYKEIGGKGYFKKALKRKEANKDKIHFLKKGYEKQAEVLYKAIIDVVKNNFN